MFREVGSLAGQFIGRMTAHIQIIYGLHWSSTIPGEDGFSALAQDTWSPPLFLDEVDLQTMGSVKTMK